MRRVVIEHQLEDVDIAALELLASVKFEVFMSRVSGDLFEVVVFGDETSL